MTTTPTKSTVSAEQARERVQAWLDLTRDDDPKDDIIVKSARGGSADMELRKSDLRALIAQHSTEPVAAGCDDEPAAWMDEAGERVILARTRFNASLGPDTARAAYTIPLYRRRFAAQGQSGAKVSRYPWKDAPEWANLAATNADGQRLWYGGPEVYQRETYWDYYGRASRMPDLGEPCPDWRDSLEQRPTGGGGDER
jgi:hypothetical protein